jgi:hypothetical protein
VCVFMSRCKTGPVLVHGKVKPLLEPDGSIVLLFN